MNVLSGLSRWSSLRHLQLTADDGDDTLTTAPLPQALLVAQSFSAFAVLRHLQSLCIDATVRSDQVEALIAMPALHCLQLTEREQRVGLQDDSWKEEEERMMLALGRLSRLVRGGRGLVQLRMPRFHFPTSADGLCTMMVDELDGALPSPMASLCLQGAVSRRGISSLSLLPSLTSLTLGWGCELDAADSTLASLPHCPALQQLHVRLVDPAEDDDHDDDAYIPSLPSLAHALCTTTLSSLSAHVPPHAWTAAHSLKLRQMPRLRKLVIAGEPAAISKRCPLSHSSFFPLVAPLPDPTACTLQLKSLSLDWLPLTDDAVLPLSSLSSLQSLQLVNCPYITSAVFFLLPSLPALVRLKVHRCEISLTAEAMDAAQTEADRLRLLHPHPAPASAFPVLQVLECHLAHRLSRDVDAPGFARFLSLLPPAHLHSFDFDSDYCTLQHILLLAGFPHLRSLGTPSVDVSPYDDDAIIAAKTSFAKAERAYYSRDYTRIQRGDRRVWRTDRRSSESAVRGQETAESERPQQDDEEADGLLVDEDGEDAAADAEWQADCEGGRWREREARWCRHHNGVEFRHREARVAFFDELRRLAADETSDSVAAEAQAAQRRASLNYGWADAESEAEAAGGGSESGQQEEEEEAAVQGSWDLDNTDISNGSEEEQEAKQDEAMSADEDEGEYEDEDEDELLLQHPSASLSILGRSLKLQSRRWKRDEKAAIKARSCFPKAADSSVSRAGRRGAAAVDIALQRKWDHDLVRVVRLASLH